MLKITELPDKLAFSKNNNSRSASSKNNSIMPVFGRNNGYRKVNKFDINIDDIEYAKKSEKLKAQNLSKLEKKPKKNKNLSKFSTKKTGLNF